MACSYIVAHQERRDTPSLDYNKKKIKWKVKWKVTDEQQLINHIVYLQYARHSK